MLRRNIHIIILTIIIGLGLSFSGCSLRSGSEPVYFKKSNLKKRIAVIPFQEYSTREGESLGGRVAAVLAQRLAQSGKVAVMPWKEVEAYISAQRIPRPLTQASAVLVGRGLRLNAVVLGSISEIDEVSGRSGFWAYIPFINETGSLNVSLVARVVDVENGTLLMAEASRGDTKLDSKKDSPANGSGKDPDRSLIDRSLDEAGRAMSKSILKVLANTPWKGYVLSASGGTAILSAGREEGVKPGDKFVILSVQDKITGATGISYVIPGPTKAALEVTRIQANTSEVRIISGQVLPGEAVYQVN